MQVIRRFLFLVIASTSVSVVTPGVMATTTDPCRLPPELGELIVRKYPDRKIITISDLSDYDRKLYKKDHGSQCPGMARVDFYGDQKPTVALVLIGGTDPKTKAILVVARQLDKNWEIKLLESADEGAVVWRQRPGKYEDVYGQESVSAPHPVIVLCGYGSWEILCAWTGNEVKKIWLSD